MAGIERATDRADENKRILEPTLVVREYRSLRNPNRCTFTALGWEPSDWDEVKVRLGGEDNPERLFLGTVVNTVRQYVGPLMQHVLVECIDNTRRMNQIKVTGRFSGDVRDVLVYLVVTYAPGITLNGVAADLGMLTEPISFSNQDLTDCIEQLARRAGAEAYLAPDGTYGDLRFFIGDEAIGADFLPDDLTPSHPSLSADDNKFNVATDGGPVVNRVKFDGGGASCLTEIEAGETILPLEDPNWYNDLGGVVIVPHSEITYTARVIGGGGSLVGPGAAPSSAPTVICVSGSGIESGEHSWAYVFVTAAGRTLPSPIATVTIGFVAPPSVAVVAGTPTTGAGLDAGTHKYYPVFRTAGGSTTAGPVSNSITAIGETSAPGKPVVAGDGMSGSLDSTKEYYYKGTFRRLSDGAETSPSTNSDFYFSFGATSARITPITPPSGFEFVLYRTLGDAGTGSTYFKVPSLILSGGFLVDTNSDASLGAAAPSSNNTAKGVCPVSGIPVSPDAAVTHVDMYREFNDAGAATAKLAFSVANGTTTANDSTTNAGLGATVPATNTTTANRASVSFPAGPTGTIDIELFRTPIGSAQLKKFHSVGSNTGGTVTDSTPDASLTTNAPIVDDSNLAQPEGQVLQGATEIPVANPLQFESGGGWAVIGNGRLVVRFTGRSSSALTGIPASGVGSIAAPFAYNQTITQAAQLTGIPPSGAGSITASILKGEQVNIRVIVDDEDAQDAQQLRAGSVNYRVTEVCLSDGRMAEGECRARALAYLALRRDPASKIQWRSQDKNTRAGRTINATLPAHGVNNTYKIQQVTIHNFKPLQFPFFDAVAANELETFEELLRGTRRAA